MILLQVLFILFDCYILKFYLLVVERRKCCVASSKSPSFWNGKVLVFRGRLAARRGSYRNSTYLYLSLVSHAAVRTREAQYSIFYRRVYLLSLRFQILLSTTPTAPSIIRRTGRHQTKHPPAMWYNFKKGRTAVRHTKKWSKRTRPHVTSSGSLRMWLIRRARHLACILQ
jgi:hypothetical protein